MNAMLARWSSVTEFHCIALRMHGFFLVLIYCHIEYVMWNFGKIRFDWIMITNWKVSGSHVDKFKRLHWTIIMMDLPLICSLLLLLLLLFLRCLQKWEHIPINTILKVPVFDWTEIWINKYKDTYYITQIDDDDKYMWAFQDKFAEI